jgi:DNA modification methylase
VPALYEEWGLRDYGEETVVTWPDGIKCQLGLESTIEEFIEHLHVIFAEVKRVLRRTGTCWVVIGDTYAGSGCGKGDYRHNNKRSLSNTRLYCDKPNPQLGVNLPAKCMCMIPERFAFMMLDLGFILRNKICFYKPNHMPSSCQDRLTNTWEYVYFFTKSKKYFFDLSSIREPLKETSIDRILLANRTYQGKFDGFGEEAENFGSPRARTQRLLVKDKGLTEIKNLHGYSEEQGRHIQIGLRKINEVESSATRLVKDKEYKTRDPERHISLLCKNPGDHWVINTQPYPEAHFATFPEKLVEPMILAGCPEEVCKYCGKPKGWSECSCTGENKYEPGIVLDPFAGSGTVAVVAKRLGRDFIGIDISEKYCQIARKRLSKIPERLDKYI